MVVAPREPSSSAAGMKSNAIERSPSMQIPPGPLTTIAAETLEAKVERLTKLVHILWKEVEKYEGMIQATPEGIQIKAGASEILVLKNGGIRIGGLRVLVTTPGKADFYF
jgi:hypothetical protein